MIRRANKVISAIGRSYSRKIVRDRFKISVGSLTQEVSWLDGIMNIDGKISSYHSSFVVGPLLHIPQVLPQIYQSHWNSGLLQVRTEIYKDQIFGRFIFLDYNDGWMESSVFPIKSPILSMEVLDGGDVKLMVDDKQYILQECCVASLF